MVGGKHGHERVAFAACAQMNRGEADRGGGVAADRLGEDVRCGDARQLLRTAAACSALVTTQTAVGRKQRRKARDGLLEHGLLADDIEQLLRRARAAARPEARAAASGEDDGVGQEPF